MEPRRIWLTVSNVRLRASEKDGKLLAQVQVQVQGDAGEAGENGPTWLDCWEGIVPPKGRTSPVLGAEKLYDKVVDALQNNRKVRGHVAGSDTRGVYVEEIDVRYQ
jgi:hypothetical protein